MTAEECIFRCQPMGGSSVFCISYSVLPFSLCVFVGGVCLYLLLLSKFVELVCCFLPGRSCRVGYV